jgi:CheY-like chemotaxis protein
MNIKELKLPTKKVFVIDDNTDLTETFGKLLKKLNQNVEIAYGGKAALKTINEFKPDIIFIDIAMPGMDGYELIKILRDEPDLKNSKFIAMSGFGEEFRKKSIEEGYDDHIIKPINISRLTEILSAEK